MIVKNELERIGKEVIVAYFKLLTRLRLEGLRKCMKPFI